MDNKIDLVELEYTNNKFNDVDIRTYNVLQLLRETNKVLLKNYRSILFWVSVNIALLLLTFIVILFMPQASFAKEINTNELIFISFFGTCTLLAYYLYFKVISEFNTNIEYVEVQKSGSSWVSLILNSLSFLILLGSFFAICYGLFIEYSKLDMYLNSLNFTNKRVYELATLIFIIGFLLIVLYSVVFRHLFRLVMFEVFSKGNNLKKALKAVFLNILHNKNSVLLKIIIGSFIIEIISNIIFGVLAWILDFFTLSSSIMLPGMFFIIIIYGCFICYEFYLGTFVYLTYMSADVEEKT